jgi:hypothetical protein
MRWFLVFYVVLWCNWSIAQKRPNSHHWETTVLFSSSSFLSDLGGKDGDGTNDIADLDIGRTRYAVGVGYGKQTTGGFGMHSQLFYTLLSASDQETNSSRTARNISVNTDVVEAHLLFSYRIPKYASFLPGFYVNVGGGAFLYRPRAQFEGNWYNLRPLGTEGQFADPNLEPYKLISPVIPFGFGKTFQLEHNIALSIDVSLRKSFTDYLDDVSTVYYDNAAIEAAKGPIAAALANPSENPKVGRPGSRRGNPAFNDNFFLIGLKLHLPNPKFGRVYWPTPDNWLNKYGNRPRFNKQGKTRKKLFN